ncbi:hypothetical protein ACF1DY_26120 [Streptomyces albus]
MSAALVSCFVVACSVCGLLYDEEDTGTLHLSTREEAEDFAHEARGGPWDSWRLTAGLLLCPTQDAAHTAAVDEAQAEQHCDGQLDLYGHPVVRTRPLRIQRIDCAGHRDEMLAA